MSYPLCYSFFLETGMRFELNLKQTHGAEAVFQIRAFYPQSVSGISVRACNQNIRRTLALVEEMIKLADQGDEDREDAGCGILYGILRDSAYKLKQLAEKEKLAHMKKGWWLSGSAGGR